MAIYKGYDFSNFLHASKNPLDAGSLAIAWRDVASMFERIEKQLYEMEERIEHLESSSTS